MANVTNPPQLLSRSPAAHQDCSKQSGNGIWQPRAMASPLSPQALSPRLRGLTADRLQPIWDQSPHDEASGKRPSSSCGIGVQLVKCRNGDVVVLSVREGSSAEEAGVGAGDRIVGVGSSDISGQGLDCKQVGEVLLPHKARPGLPHWRELPATGAVLVHVRGARGRRL